MSDSQQPGTLDLDAIKARADAASKGPWRYDAEGFVGNIPVIVQAPHGWVIGSVLMHTDFDDGIPEQASKNGPFIAHAREDIPAMLAEIDRLKAENHALRIGIAGNLGPDELAHYSPVSELVKACRVACATDYQAHMMRMALKKIAQPALGGKQQQFIAQETLAAEEAYARDSARPEQEPIAVAKTDP